MADTQMIGSTAETPPDIKLFMEDDAKGGIGRFAINGVQFILRVWTPEEWAAIGTANAREPDHREMTNGLRYQIEVEKEAGEANGANGASRSFAYSPPRF